jgi:hypothetical protein
MGADVALLRHVEVDTGVVELGKEGFGEVEGVAADGDGSDGVVAGCVGDGIGQVAHEQLENIGLPVDHHVEHALVEGINHHCLDGFHADVLDHSSVVLFAVAAGHRATAFLLHVLDSIVEEGDQALTLLVDLHRLDLISNHRFDAFVVEEDLSDGK